MEIATKFGNGLLHLMCSAGTRRFFFFSCLYCIVIEARILGLFKIRLTMAENVQEQESRPLALTPTWSVATVLTIFVAVSLFVDRSIHHLTNWLRKINQKPLLAALEKMKEEMMMLGFISLLLTATSSIIANICIPSKFYNSGFSPCTRSDIDDEMKKNGSKERKLLMASTYPQSFRRILDELNTSCNEGYKPFVSYEGLEQLHRFIFLMAVTHIPYSCLTMLLAIVKIQSWRVWEDDAHMDRHNSLAEIMRQSMRRQSILAKFHTSNPLVRDSFLIWVTCFFRQFGHSVVRADYLPLRKGFIMNHNLTLKYDFHSYMIRSMEEEFQKIVGVSGPLWGFVVAFMLFNIKAGSILYFMIAIIPISLVLLVGTKLQHVIITLALENAETTGIFSGEKSRPRDELFWFKKPELLLSLIHFILFQNSFELATFFWFWWQFGYNSCFIKHHLLVHLRLILGFAGQFLCSYSTLPLYALVTQMGTNYKAALIPQNIRDAIDEWGKAARRKSRHGMFNDDSTIHRHPKDDQFIIDTGSATVHEVELQPIQAVSSANEASSRVQTPLHRHSSSVSSSVALSFRTETMPRSASVRSRR